MLANICSYAPAMLYLRRRDQGPAGAWWVDVERYPHSAPGIVRELLRAMVDDPAPLTRPIRATGERC